MLNVTWQFEHTVIVRNVDDQVLLSRNENGEIDASLGQATVGAETPPTASGAQVHPNVDDAWIQKQLQNIGCDEQQVAEILERLHG